MELANKRDSILLRHVCSTPEKDNKAKTWCKLYCLKLMIVHVVVVQSNISTAYDKKHFILTIVWSLQ